MLRDLFTNFASNFIPMSAQQQKRKKASRISGEQSRALRNAQSAINKDIRATKRELGKAAGDERANLQAHLDALRDLRDHMRASRNVDGEKQYNVRSTRVDAMNEYLGRFKGRSRREQSRETVIDRTPIDNRLYGNLANMLRDVMDDIMWSPNLEDLLEEYYDAVRSYDYERALETLNRMRGNSQSIRDMYETPGAVLGTADYDGR